MESLNVLAIRVLVGVVLSLAGAFIGTVFNGLIVPTPAAGDEIAFTVRLFVLGFSAAIGGILAWFNLTDSNSGAGLLFATTGLSGTFGAAIAYFIGRTVIDNPDLFILNQQQTQAVVVGAALGATAFAAAFALYRFKGRRGAPL